MTNVFLNAVMSFLVLIQVLLAEETLVALGTFERPRSYFVSFHMSSMSILGRESLAADFAHVRAGSGVRICVFLKEVP